MWKNISLHKVKAFERVKNISEYIYIYIYIYIIVIQEK